MTINKLIFYIKIYVVLLINLLSKRKFSFSVFSFRGRTRISHRTRHLSHRVERASMQWEDRYEQSRFEVGESYRSSNQEEYVESTLVKKPDRSTDGTARVHDVPSKLRERWSIFTSEIRAGSTTGIRTYASPAYAPNSAAHGPTALRT